MAARSILKFELAKAVRRLIAAEIENAWKGAKDPRDIPAIEQELKDARTGYRRALSDLADGP